MFGLYIRQAHNKCFFTYSICYRNLVIALFGGKTQRTGEVNLRRELKEGTLARLTNGSQESSGIQICFVPSRLDMQTTKNRRGLTAFFISPRQILESLQGTDAET